MVIVVIMLLSVGINMCIIHLGGAAAVAVSVSEFAKVGHEDDCIHNRVVQEGVVFSSNFL